MVAIDPDREAYEAGLPFIEKAGVAHKIQYIDSDAMSVIKDFISNVSTNFDFV